MDNPKRVLQAFYNDRPYWSDFFLLRWKTKTTTTTQASTQTKWYVKIPLLISIPVFVIYPR